jgi:hypothetical protein
MSLSGQNGSLFSDISTSRERVHIELVGAYLFYADGMQFKEVVLGDQQKSTPV